MAAVGVAFLLAVAINRQIKKLSSAQLISLLDLVALGTVCDVMPLKGVNRAFVTQGLKIMAKRQNPGLVALADIAGITDAPSAYHCGFVFGPRINAGGRVGESELGVTLLSSEDGVRLPKLAEKLQHYNQERQAIEQLVLEEAKQQCENISEDAPVLFAIGEGWHEGVIGIVAGRIKEQFHRPSAVIAIKDGIGKASARSIPGIDFGAAIMAANQQGLLLAGGGHAMAAGFSIEAEKIPALQTFLAQHFAKDFDAHRTKNLTIHGYVSIGGLTKELLSHIERCAPFGMGNPEPRFVLNDVFIVNPRIVGGKHISAIAAESGGKSIKIIAFQSVDTVLGNLLLNSKGQKMCYCW